MSDYYTIADLFHRDILDANTLVPARLAVIGHPIAHSKSPQIQTAALKSLGLEETMRYIRIDLDIDNFARGIEQLRHLGFIGCNVTIPHKQAAYALADKCDAFGDTVKAINTLHFTPQGIMGYNTDGPGFIAAIRQEFSLDIQDLKILILGAAGGAGTAISYACARQGCEQLILVNRTYEKALKLQKLLSPYFIDENRLSGASDRLQSIAWDDTKQLANALRDVDLIVNASSIGMSPVDASPLPSRMILPTHIVFDTLTHNTKLQEEALQRGARVSNGTPMLIQQGALSMAHWIGTLPDTSLMKAALA